MLKKFSLYNEEEMRRWDNFVMTHPMGTPFHLSSWLRIIYETYSFEPGLLVYTNESDEIAGLFPYFVIKGLFSRPRIVSVPFSDYSFPLTMSDDVENKILNYLVEQNTSSFIEIRGPVRDNSKYKRHNIYQGFNLELDPEPSKVYKNFDKRTIVRCIKKAEKEGVKIIEDNSPEGVDNFYRLNKLTRKKHGVPCQSRKFFEKITEHMVSKGLAFILLAKFESDVIAASMFFKFNKTIHYKYNASDPAYLSSKTPNHLLIWHLIEKSCLQGFDTIDLGRTAKDNHGLTRYKNMWGAKPYELPYYYYPVAKGASSQDENGISYKIMTGIWKHLPDIIVDRVGPVLMKQLA